MLSLDWNLLAIVVNLLIFYIVIKKFLVKPVRDIIAKRQEEINLSIDEANKTKKEAEDLLSDCKRKEESIKEEEKAILSEARKKANEEYNRIIDSASNKADAIIEKAKMDADAKKQKSIEEFRDEITRVAIDAASKIVETSDSYDDNKKLYDDFIKKAGEDSDSNK